MLGGFLSFTSASLPVLNTLAENSSFTFTNCLYYIRVNQNLHFLVIHFLFVLINEILAPGFIVVNFNTGINFSEKHYFSLEGVFSF